MTTVAFALACCECVAGLSVGAHIMADTKYLADQIAEAFAAEYADSRATLDVLDRKAFAVATGSGAFVGALLAMARLDFGPLSAVCVFASALMLVLALIFSTLATWVAYVSTRPSGDFVREVTADLANAADVSDPEFRFQNQLSHSWRAALKDTKEAVHRKADRLTYAQFFLCVAAVLTTAAIGVELLLKGETHGDREEAELSQARLP